ncbi:hypothetical protein B0H65DRAFT_565870 [Neurospora tetraspora]|uniref:Uncharacterized protein n=1 Tax=Neurospora tetraspora TaxID=94610 RepID=A0AAE0MKL1_9PEZI|nr:hypothetical protein B0H65DRAFT_565870 [Neurospora tetraspora]
MLYRQLSKLAVVGERSEAPKANQSRLRRPTPYSIEHYRHEGVRASKDDNPPVDSPRGRSQSSTWTPTRTRAPTPHPSATKSRRREEEKTVQWTDSLEQESPVQKSVPATALSERKSAMKRQTTTEQKEASFTEKEEDRPDNSSEEPAMPKTDEEATLTEAQPRALRRDRRSSIPRQKFIVSRNISKPIALPSTVPNRPPSPLIPQAVPAPLRLSQRRHRGQAISSSASAAAVTSSKARYDHQPVSKATRDFSFDDKPEAITVSFGSAHQSHESNTTKDRSVSSQPPSYLQMKPKRSGTTRARPTPPEAVREPVCAEDCKEIKPAASLPKSSSTQTFATAKSFWAEKSAGTSVSDRNTSQSKSTSTSKPSAKSFWSDISASSSCVAVVSGYNSETPKPALPRNARDLPKTFMVSNLSRYTVNGGGRSGEKRSTECTNGNGNVSVSSVSGSSTAVMESSSTSTSSSSALSYRSAQNDKTAPGKRSSSKIPLPKPQDHSKPAAASSVSAASKSSTDTSSYRTANSHLSATSASNSNTSASNHMAANSTSIEAEYILTIQSDLWNEIMDFCRSDSSSLMPGEQRYCDCDDCVWGGERNVEECSTVARVGEGKCRARRE